MDILSLAEDFGGKKNRDVWAFAKYVSKRLSESVEEYIDCDPNYYGCEEHFYNYNNCNSCVKGRIKDFRIITPQPSTPVLPDEMNDVVYLELNTYLAKLQNRVNQIIRYLKSQQ